VQSQSSPAADSVSSHDAAQPAAGQDTPAAAPPLASTPGARKQQQRVLESMAVVFDPQLPEHQQQQLAAEVAACGGRVVPRPPHLGCAATAVIAEPAAAAKWLPLLLDVVSPSWLAKACKQQQQQLLQVSPDVARVWGAQLQQQAQAAAYGGVSWHSSRQIVVTPSKEGVAANQQGGEQQQQQPQPQPQQQNDDQLPVLCVPRAALIAARAGDSVSWQQQGFGAQQQQVLLPASVLTDLVWSVDQHPR
jgi:hypothetical protein